MSETLTYYLGSTSGMTVVNGSGGSVVEVANHFEGKTLEYLTGCQDQPEVAFAGVAFDGGYRTADAGKTWRKVLDADVRAFTIDPHDERIVYAGAGPIRLFRSEDRGLNWEPLDTLLDLSESVKGQWTVPEPYRGKLPPHISGIFLHPDDPRFLILCLEHGGLAVSRDGGESWHDASTGVAYLDMHVIRNLPRDREHFLMSNGRGFFKSDDLSGPWSRTEDGMPWAYTERFSYSHNWLYCPGNPVRIVLAGAKGSPGIWDRETGSPHGYILLSDDLGASWRHAADLSDDLPWIPWTLQPHPSESGTVFAGMGDGSRGFGFDPQKRGDGSVYRSDDRGETWTPVISNLPTVQALWVAPG